MRVLLEFKSRLKGLYSKYEIYLLPFLKFGMSMLFLYWINSNMGYMEVLNSIFVMLIVSVICAILPLGAMVICGCVFILLHAYAVCLEAAGFLLVLLIFMLILFLRFSSEYNIVLILTPLCLGIDLPVLLPIGAGLMGSAVSALPAACGVILFYFIRFINEQSATLMGSDLDILAKIGLLADGLVQNWIMWLNVIAFIIVILVVVIIRTRSFNWAWRVSIIAGGLCYIAVMFGGARYLELDINIGYIAAYTAIAVLIGVIMEFFIFGGDYSRTERLQFEDDEYYYYVKAIPKFSVSTAERKVKKISGDPHRSLKAMQEIMDYTPEEEAESESESEEEYYLDDEEETVEESSDMEAVDLEKQLEESLKDL